VRGYEYHKICCVHIVYQVTVHNMSSEYPPHVTLNARTLLIIIGAHFHGFGSSFEWFDRHADRVVECLFICNWSSIDQGFKCSPQIKIEGIEGKTMFGCTSKTTCLWAYINSNSLQLFPYGNLTPEVFLTILDAERIYMVTASLHGNLFIQCKVITMRRHKYMCLCI
jgi:hypothetical protein